MQIQTKRTLLMGFASSVAFTFYFIPNNSVQISSEPATHNAKAFEPQAQAIPGLPVRLTIPDIKVDSAFEHVGLTSEGVMDIPKNIDDVGWFELGPRPGENGSAVIAGHYGWKKGKASVFDNLHSLRQGDRVYIEDEKGETISFVVRESRRYDPKADASEVFNSNDGKAHLNLITCEGVWDAQAQQYTKRLVVFTDKEIIHSH